MGKCVVICDVLYLVYSHAIDCWIGLIIFIQEKGLPCGLQIVCLQLIFKETDYGTGPICGNCSTRLLCGMDLVYRSKGQITDKGKSSCT